MSDSGVNQLPPSIQGDGRKFISLLKNYLKGIASDLEKEIKKVESIYNVLADNPDTIPEQVKSIKIEEKAVNGAVSLLISWDSSSIKQYNGASIDIKVGDFTDEMDAFTSKEIVRHYDTPKTNTFTLDNIDVGKKYWIRIRGKDVRNALSETHNAPVTLYYVGEGKYVPRPPYEATVVFNKLGAYWSWKQYPQNEYQWTELRLDEHVGEEHNRLDLTTDWSSTAKPYTRSGTGYLYNKGVGNSYSSPAKIEYSKAVPNAPLHVLATPVFEGLRIDFDVIPEDCYGANVYIDNQKYFVQDNKFSFNCSTGSYTIKVAYLDIFGEGEMSKEITISTLELIPTEMINTEKLGLANINKSLEELNRSRAELDNKIFKLENADTSANKKLDDLVKARQEIDKKIGGLTTSLTTMEGSINAKVKDAKDTAEARLTATKEAIDTSVADNIKKVNSSITQLSDRVDAKIKDAKADTESKLTLTKDALNTSINDKAKELSSSITQLSNSVDIKVKAVKDNAESRLTATEKAINSSVTDNVNKLKTSITQVAGDIEVKVNAGINKLTGKEIISRINLSKDTVSISGKFIHITGDTIFDDKVIVTRHIGDKAVVGTKIADGAISTDKLVANAVTGDKIAANSITADKIKVGEIKSKHMAAQSIEGTKIVYDTMDGRSIKTGTLTGDRLAANTISGDKIKAGTIESNHIASKSIGADKIKVDKLSVISEEVGDLHGGSITGGTFKNDNGSFEIDPNGNIRGANITGANITGSRIDASSVYANGVPLKNTNFMSLHIVSGQKIQLPVGYRPDRCLYYLTNLSTKVAYEQGGRYFNQGDLDKIHDFNNKYSTYWNDSPTGGRMNDLDGVRWLHGEPLQNRVFFPNGDKPSDGTFSTGKEQSERWFGGCGITAEGYFYYFHNSGRKGTYGEADLLVISFW